VRHTAGISVPVFDAQGENTIAALPAREDRSDQLDEVGSVLEALESLRQLPIHAGAGYGRQPTWVQRRGETTRVEQPWRTVNPRPIIELVHSLRTPVALAIALAVTALCGPGLAEAAPKPPDRFEGVTITRYLMGRVQPSSRARGTAHLWTNTGFSNRRAVYPVLRHRTLSNESEWVQVKVLRGRKTVKVWIPRWATRRVWLDYRVQVDLSSRKAKVYRQGKLVKRFRVVVGARSTPTPTGHFFVVDRLHLRDSWARGGWALATSAFSRVLTEFAGGQGQVAMHTRGSLTAPVGTAASHGCVRFNDKDIRWMAAHVPNGTPVWIQR
jgi:lipoprotein-anchoring transpeptidase ErfK/SrfK